jgi:hypothetical protein
MGIVERHSRYVFSIRGVAAPLKLKYDVQSVDDTLLGTLVGVMSSAADSSKRTHRNITKNSQQDVDKEISIAAALEEDAQRWEDDGEQDLADVAVEMLAVVLMQYAKAVQTYLAVKGMVSVLLCVWWLFAESSMGLRSVWKSIRRCRRAASI